MPDETPPPHPAPADRRHASWARAIGAGDELPIDPDLTPGDPAEPAPTHRPGPRGPRRLRPVTLASVFAGGALGTLCRYGFERAWPTAPGHFPTATFVINTSGALVLGLVLVVLIERLPHLAPRLRPLLGTGFLGGWTTYSTLVVEADTLAKGGRPAMAAGYVAVTLVCGLSAAALGIALGRSRTVRGPEPETAP